MEIITRAIYEEVKSQLKPGRVLLLLGGRRVGKSHLLKHEFCFGEIDKIDLFNF